jgi:hypothetical protein
LVRDVSSGGTGGARQVPPEMITRLLFGMTDLGRRTLGGEEGWGLLPGLPPRWGQRFRGKLRTTAAVHELVDQAVAYRLLRDRDEHEDDHGTEPVAILPEGAMPAPGSLPALVVLAPATHGGSIPEGCDRRLGKRISIHTRRAVTCGFGCQAGGSGLRPVRPPAKGSQLPGFPVVPEGA